MKSALKSLPKEDAQGKSHPIRRSYSNSFGRGARDTAQSATFVTEQVRVDPVEPIRDGRAGRAIPLVVRPEHEVVNQQLRASAKEVRQGRAAVLGLEPVALVDPHPRELLPAPRQLVAARGLAPFRRRGGRCVL